ncbi:MAG: peroxiredoxin [Caulobacteraceae bacterium]|nr:peroxiredoxin [Caulobacter sp.]
MRLARTLALAASAAALLVAGAAHAALPVGATAPEFSAQGALAGKTFSFDLQKALARGPVVLYFFPAAFTSGCTKEAHDFAEASAQFTQAGATLVGITAGNVDRVADFSKVECRDKFAVLADPGAKIAKTYKATNPLTDMKGWSDRTSYVIGQDGKIKLAYSNLNPDKHVDETLAEVKALKTGA